MKANAPWFLLAHGAGAGSSSPWMRRWQKHLERLGPVVTFDFPYVLEGRRRPDPLPRLIDAHRAALESASAHQSGPAVLVGKSMGGRIGCHLALERPVLAVICLGYPLRSPAARRGPAAGSALRDTVLLQMTTPILFVQGTRDPLCPLDLLDSVRSRMKAPQELFVVPTGNHSLEATKTHLKQTGTSQEELELQAVAAIENFLTHHLPRAQLH